PQRRRGGSPGSCALCQALCQLGPSSCALRASVALPSQRGTMRAITSIAAIGAVTGAIVATAPAAAQPKPSTPVPKPVRPVQKVDRGPRPAEMVGMTKLGAMVPAKGFVDDVVATDGHRLAVIVTDAAGLIEARVVGDDGVEQVTLGLDKIIGTVRRLYLLTDRMFLVGDDSDGGPVTGTLIGFNAKGIKKHGPASEVFLRTIAGKDAVVLYDGAPGKPQLTHKIRAVDVLTGKPIGKKAGQLIVGADGRDAKLDFRPVYFMDDMTVAVGIK